MSYRLSEIRVIYRYTRILRIIDDVITPPFFSLFQTMILCMVHSNIFFINTDPYHLSRNVTSVPNNLGELLLKYLYPFPVGMRLSSHCTYPKEHSMRGCILPWLYSAISYPFFILQFQDECEFEFYSISSSEFYESNLSDNPVDARKYTTNDGRNKTSCRCRWESYDQSHALSLKSVALI